MKKIVITALLILPLLSFIAQEEEGKNFRFGLMGNTSIGWLTPDDERKFSSGGVGLGLGWGLQMEFKLGKTTSFVTGLNLESYKASLNYDDPDLSATSKPTYYDLNSDFEYFDTLLAENFIQTLNYNEAHKIYSNLEKKKFSFVLACFKTKSENLYCKRSK